MTDFSLSNMDYTPVKFMIKIFEANFPESLGHICVHRAPWVFSSIWNIIKGWLDPVVAAKINFTKDIHDLSQYVDVKNIPKELGGEEDYVYKYIEPEQGENAEMEAARKDGRLAKLEDERKGIVKKFEERTIEWCKGEGGDDLPAQRRTLVDRLKSNYWAMDPFVRGRTLYDRQGVIKREGAIDMYPWRHAETNDDLNGVD